MTSRVENTSNLNMPISSEDPKYLPVFSKANTLLLNSGNIVSSQRLKQRTNLNPEDELADAIDGTLSIWLGSIDRSKIQENKVIECRNPEFYEKLTAEELNDISISVKLFLNSFDPEVLNKSIEKIMNEIGTDHIDTLILAFPDKVFNYDELPKDLILPLWSIIQKNVKSKKITTAGISDFNANYLEQLMNALEDKNEIPLINQVNLTSCCKMPEDLVEYAKINKVQLTTHIDPKEILSIDNLQSNIKKHTHDYDGQGWIHLWVARYTLLLKGRGILKSKGYIVNAQRELRFTKQ